jgi:predicted ferric reductase
MAPAVVAVAVDPFTSPRPARVELSAAVGLIAFALILVQFALVSHVRSMSRPFGTDALVQFHRYMGLIAIGLVVVHPLLLNSVGLAWSAWNPLSGGAAVRSGSVAFWALAGLVGTTIWRRRLGLSYEAWRITHLLLSIAAAGAMLVHIAAVDGYSRASPMKVAIWGYALAFGAILIGYRLVRPLRLRTRPWTLVENRDEGASVRTLRLRPVGHPGLAFDPGQFVWLITGRSPFSLQEHPLSISSSAEGPADGSIELSIKALGDWSRDVVPHLQAGTRLWVDGPFGAFTTEGAPGQGFVLIAGGIGIAPMRSLVTTMRDRGDRRHVILFVCARDESRVPFRREIERLRSELNLDLIEVFEQASAEWRGERGYLTPDVLRRHLPASYLHYHYFVCGPPAMMDAVEAGLLSLGVPARSIDSERFEGA